MMPPAASASPASSTGPAPSAIDREARQRTARCRSPRSRRRPACREPHSSCRTRRAAAGRAAAARAGRNATSGARSRRRRSLVASRRNDSGWARSKAGVVRKTSTILDTARHAPCTARRKVAAARTDCACTAAFAGGIHHGRQGHEIGRRLARRNSRPSNTRSRARKARSPRSAASTGTTTPPALLSLRLAAASPRSSAPEDESSTRGAGMAELHTRRSCWTNVRNVRRHELVHAPHREVDECAACDAASRPRASTTGPSPTGQRYCH